MSVLGILLVLLFMAAQGAAVFGTANLALRLLKASSRAAKVAAMAISYVVWIAFTIGAYAMLGGDGGLMDGFGLVLFLCFTALISSFIYLLVWAILAPAKANS